MKWFVLMLALIAADPVLAAQKRIALTFDDVPRAAGAFLTPADRRLRLIAALKVARVKAAFFVNPGRLARPDGPALADEIMAYARAGHILANHSYSHPALSEMPLATYLVDVDKAASWLHGRHNARAWYRFPYLDEGGNDAAKRDGMRAELQVRGIMAAPITVDAWDWNLEERAVEAVTAGWAVNREALIGLCVRGYVESANAADAFAKQILGRSIAQVMLLHEADVTTLCLPDLIGALRADGWQIVSPHRAYRDPVYRIEPQSLPAGGPLLDAIARDRGIALPFGIRYNDPAVSNALFDREVLGKVSP